MSTITLVLCGKCGGHYARLDRDNAECVSCGRAVSVSMDIRPHMEEGETLVWGEGSDLLGYVSDLTDQERATVLAALRFYQENGQGDPSNRTDAIHDIATNDDGVISLDEAAIDELCERLNLGAMA